MHSPEADPSPRASQSYCRRWETPDGMVHFQLPYGAWIRLFRDSALTVEDLVEPPAPAGAIPSYLDERRRAWAEQWPFECIWKTRKQKLSSPQDRDSLARSRSDSGARTEGWRRWLWYGA